MNDVVLQQLAQEIVKQTVISSWPYYLVLVFFSFIGATLSPFFKARFTKRGEVSATKAETTEILRQLKEATAATKSVELSLAQGDWIQRERNTLKRLKLEQLIVAAYAISDWTSNDSKQALSGEPPVDICPINEFVMLATLYFPELKEKTKAVEERYRIAMIEGGPTRIKVLKLTAEIDALRQNSEAELHRAAVESRLNIQQAEQPGFIQRAMYLHVAVEELAQAAHELMEHLTARPAATR
ncbi:hypothetical protein LE190_15985 [Massilia oculi]|uniref:Uncharacterized protein n=1 Tax=Massilia hydrophila TaxID=3044279 RepID=A0ABS7YDG9_9BURK|nr:hypothetical protein [Massilia oculi]MCA1857413.1 hypothetical protein [Massilia oculi]